MPTCSQKRKCTQNKTKCHRVPFSPRPCIESHRIPHFSPHFCSPTCHNPSIHSHFPNHAHCMASVKKSPDCSEDDSEDEERKENMQIVQCPYISSTQDLETHEDNKLKTCCIRNVDSKGQEQPQILPPGFKAHISVDIASDSQSSLAQRPEVCCNRAKKSLDNVPNQQKFPKETSPPKSNQQDQKSPCCAKSQQPSQTDEGLFKLSAQGILKHRTDSTPLIKNIDSEVMSVQSIESAENASEKPCCASAYPRVKPEPILPPKGISGTARPGYVVNKESPDPIAEEIPSECMTDGGCIHGISSIMPKDEQKRESSCFCGAKSKKESHVCDATKRLSGQKRCPCRYPPGYSQFSCAGNITGVCKCTGEFK